MDGMQSIPRWEMYLNPVSKAVQDELTHDRVVTVEGVSTARVIVVLSSRGKHVVGPVVDAAE